MRIIGIILLSGMISGHGWAEAATKTRQVVDSAMKLPASGIVELRIMKNFNNNGVIQRMNGQFVFASYGNRKNI